MNTLDQLFRDIVAEHADPVVQLGELGMVYVLYAIDHPAAFRLMFRPEKGSPFGDEPAATAVFGVLLQVVRACREKASCSSEDTEHVAFAAWSLVHGLAVLLLDGLLASVAADREQVRALVATATTHFDVNR